MHKVVGIIIFPLTLGIVLKLSSDLFHVCAHYRKKVDGEELKMT